MEVKTTSEKKVSCAITTLVQSRDYEEGLASEPRVKV